MPATYLKKGVQPPEVVISPCINGNTLTDECISATENRELAWTLHCAQGNVVCSVMSAMAYYVLLCCCIAT